MTLLTVVSPAHNEAENLPVMYERLKTAMSAANLDWRWIVVDDHSGDGTFEVLRDLAERDHRVSGIRFARNFGSHLAIFSGLELADGDCLAVMASDLEDPPELLCEMVAAWRDGAQVVWAVREKREDKGVTYRVLAGAFYWFMRRVLGVEGMPSSGADFFMIDGAVKDMLRQYRDKHLSLFALVGWLGLTSTTVSFVKQSRRFGASSWSMRKYLKLIVDTMVGFSHFPIRMMSLTGVGVTIAGALLSLYVVWNALTGSPPRAGPH